MTEEATGNGATDAASRPPMADAGQAGAGRAASRATTSSTAGQAKTSSSTAGSATTSSGTASQAETSSTTGSAGIGATGRPEDPAVDAWRGLLVAHSRLVPAVEADLRAAGQVPLSWYDVLLELNAAPERRLRMSELGQRVVLSRTRVSRIVDELAAAGLAERQPDQADGRSSFAVLTTAGRDALRRAWPVYREAIRRHLAAGLTVPQCRELAALLDQVIKGTEITGP
ncbi:MAG TPA: MarR family winged helix-turn-helix transcriptional regulator [Streptosporangiaceae bacterium]|nr:MarR family winged helix-turn-helix transcriptional regulator [Streptosporangiaceae bacterium]